MSYSEDVIERAFVRYECNRCGQVEEAVYDRIPSKEWKPELKLDWRTIRSELGSGPHKSYAFCQRECLEAFYEEKVTNAYGEPKARIKERRPRPAPVGAIPVDGKPPKRAGLANP